MKQHKTALSLLLCVYFLISCAPSVPKKTVTPQSTQALFETDAVTEVLKPEDIVYENDVLPAVYITTGDGKQVTSKDVYSPCGFRIELNGIYAEFESTYTDENGGGAQLQCRGNTSFTREQVQKILI